MEYKYDGVGRLTGRKDADGEQVFVQAGWNIMTEQDTEGRRTYYTGSSSQTNNGGEANFFLFNHRGDTVLITDQTGEVSNSLHYEAYGKVTDKTGTPIPANSIPTSTPLPPLFVGAYGIRYDRKTELSYMRFRWYSVSLNRFINLDKMMNLNRYDYAGGNPIKYIDPTGLRIEFAGNSEDIKRLEGILSFIESNSPPEIKVMIQDLRDSENRIQIVFSNDLPENTLGEAQSFNERTICKRGVKHIIYDVMIKITRNRFMKSYSGKECFDLRKTIFAAGVMVHELYHAWLATFAQEYQETLNEEAIAFSIQSYFLAYLNPNLYDKYGNPNESETYKYIMKNIIKYSNNSANYLEDEIMRKAIGNYIKTFKNSPYQFLDYCELTPKIPGKPTSIKRYTQSQNSHHLLCQSQFFQIWGDYSG